MRSMGPIAAVGPIAMVWWPNRWLLGQHWCPLEPFAAAGPIAAGPEPVAVGPEATGVKLDSARAAGLPHRYVPLHHGGAVDDAVVVGDGLDVAD